MKMRQLVFLRRVCSGLWSKLYSQFRYKQNCRGSAKALSNLVLHLLVLGGAGLVSTVSASTQHISMEDQSPVSISVSNAFESGPNGGHAPIRVRIDNGMKRDGTWSFKTEISSGYYDAQKSFVTHHNFFVPAGQSQVFELSIPVPLIEDSARYYNHTNLKGRFRGPFTVSWSTMHLSLMEGRGSSSANHALLFSPEIHRKHGNAIAELYENRGNEQTIVTYDASLLNNDWRSYIGFQFIVMTRGDWLKLPSDVREAIMYAVQSGRTELRFYLPKFSRSIAEELGIPMKPEIWQHGFGLISRYSDDLEPILDNRTRAKSAKIPMLKLESPWKQLVRTPDQELFYSQTIRASEKIDRLESVVPDKTPPTGFLSLLMVVFAMVAAPLNLFLFAGGKNRLRMFVSTPIISIVTGGLLLLGILFGDGVGGNGYIARIIYLRPDTGKLFVEQDQYVETGLFFGNEFEVAGDDYVSPLGLSITTVKDMENYGEFTRVGEIHSGDWFSSKRIQALNYGSYVSSRESIDLVSNSWGDGVPEIFSNFRAICETLYYFDEDGRAWKGEGLKLGARMQLTEVKPLELIGWLDRHGLQSGYPMQSTLKQFGLQHGHFYASIRNWEQEGLDTVSGIDWNIHSQLLVGQFRDKTQKGGTQ